MLFLAKTVTVALAILLVVIGILGFSAKQKQVLKSGKLQVVNLSEKIKEQQQELKTAIYGKKQLKALLKQEAKNTKIESKNIKKSDKQLSFATAKPRLFILGFDGDIKASAVTSLQHCLNAILPIVDKTQDEILIKLESGGGMVHAYGLAASQLDRIKQHGVRLVVCIDKIAASGGYMMACVADKVIAAPFAIVGSIGVIGQVPNFNKLLEKHNIEFEQHTAGEFKRTITMFGKNDNKAREKFKEELDITHDLFKQYITNRRGNINIDEVATGEHWYGQLAFQKNLVDKIATSDEVVLEYSKTHDLFEVSYQYKKPVSERLFNTANSLIKLFKTSLSSS